MKFIHVNLNMCFKTQNQFMKEKISQTYNRRQTTPNYLKQIY